MSESSKEMAAILLKAMQLERDGHAFYLAAAEATASSAGRDMFLSLARDEMKHLELLDKVYRSWVGEGTWPSAESLLQEGARRWPIFPPPAKAGEVVQARSNELEALRQGIQAEEGSIALYQEGLASTTIPAAQEVYRFLIGEEEGHRTILQGEYDYLTNTGFWFDLREFDLESLS